LLMGFARDQKTIDAKMVREAASDLDMTESPIMSDGPGNIDHSAEGKWRGTRSLLRFFRR
jgi:hypothetical protein